MTQQAQTPTDQAKKAKALKLGKKLLTILCIVLAALYCCYQFYQWRVPSVKTEVALEQSVYNAVDAQIFVVRDEYILPNTASGKVIPLVEDGERVAKGDVVAMVFQNDEDAANYLRAQELKNQISYYEQLSKQLATVSDINALNEDVFSLLLDCLDTVDSGKFSHLGDRTDELKNMLIRRQMTMGEEIDFPSMISALKAELDGLTVNESAYTKITAERSGYYISSTDGLEGAIPYGQVSSVTQDTLQKALEAKAKPDSGGVGKIVDSFNWYLLCTIQEEKALSFERGDSITVRMPFSAQGAFQAEVENIAQSEDGKNLVTLKCNLMNENFANLRQETAQLVTNVTVYYAETPPEDKSGETEKPKPKQYIVDKGIRVSSSAVRVVDGEKGVYVRRGNVARFRKLNVVYSDQTYVISATTDRDGNPIVDDPDGYLKQYDEVILEGKDLYDGKIID